MDPVAEALKAITAEREALASQLDALQLAEASALEAATARHAQLVALRAARVADFAALTERVRPLELERASDLGWRRHVLKVGQEVLRAALGIAGLIGWTMAITRGDIDGWFAFWILLGEGAALWWLGNFANHEEQSL